MQNALQGLVDAGVIKRNQTRAPADAPTISSIGERGAATIQTLHGLRMPQQTSANVELAEVPATDAPVAPRLERRPALECLAKIAAHHGVDLPAERLRHAYAVDGAPISQVLLIRMAKEAGLRAKATRLDWDALFRLGQAYPALVRLANGNWVIVSGAGERPGGEGMVSVIDPLAERQHEPLVVGREPFCANWQGETQF